MAHGISGRRSPSKLHGIVQWLRYDVLRQDVVFIESATVPDSNLVFFKLEEESDKLAAE